MAYEFKKYDLSNIKSKTKDIMYSNICDIYKEYQILYSKYIELENNNKENNGGNNMFNMEGLFGEFGKIENGSVALTFNGQIAVKRNENEYVRYNKETETMENQMDMVLKEASDLIFILPVNKVEVDDIIKHKKTYYQILKINENGSLRAVNIKDGSKKTIIKETNIMGFSFYYKVVSLFNQNGITNTTTSGIDPMILMMLNSDKEEGENDDLLPLLLMNNIGSQENSTNLTNPMMLMMLLKGNKNGKKTSNLKDLLMIQMMSNQKSNQTMNPMMLMAMSGGKMDMKTLMLMNMMNGNKQQDNRNFEL